MNLKLSTYQLLPVKTADGRLWAQNCLIPLHVIGKNFHRQKLILYRCVCGTERILTEASVKSGNTRSCGCLQRKLLSIRASKHGGSSWPEYRVWCAMKERCYLISDPAYANYGGRGISVCERWKISFANFINDMGRRPSDFHSLDRIDNDGNYEATNCRWATRLEQNNNQRIRKDAVLDSPYRIRHRRCYPRPIR